MQLRESPLQTRQAARLRVVLVASGGARLDRGAVLVVVGVLAYAVYTVLLRSASPSGSGGTSRSARVSVNPVEPAAASDSVVLAAATAVWGLAFLLAGLGSCCWTCGAARRCRRGRGHPLPRAGCLRRHVAAVDLRRRPDPGQRVRVIHRRDPRPRLRLRCRQASRRLGPRQPVGLSRWLVYSSRPGQPATQHRSTGRPPPRGPT